MVPSLSTVGLIITTELVVTGILWSTVPSSLLVPGTRLIPHLPLISGAETLSVL